MYNIEVSGLFEQQVRKLSKLYPSIKDDIAWLIDTLEKYWPIWISLWAKCYKIRLKNSDNNKWKSWWYRVISLLFEDDKISLLSIYSKNNISSISSDKIDKMIKEFYIKYLG